MTNESHYVDYFILFKWSDFEVTIVLVNIIAFKHIALIFC